MNPYLRRIRARLFWMSLIALVVAIGSFSLNQWAYSNTDDQCTWKVTGGTVRIIEILPGGVAEQHGLLEGDELLAIQGRKIKPTLDGLLEAQSLIDSKEEGTVLSYTIRREGEILQIPVGLVKPLQSFQLALLINGIIFWFIGLLVVSSTPERKSSRHFFYIGCSALLISALSKGLIPAAPKSLILSQQIAGAVGQALIPALWVHFFTRFPHPFSFRRDRRFLLGLYGGLACVALVSFAVQIIGNDIADAAQRLNFLGQWQAGVLVLNMLAALAGLILFAIGVRRMPPHRRTYAMLPLVVVSAMMLDLIALAVFSRIYQGNLIFQRKQWIFVAAMPLLPLSFGYAVIRHGLFDVRKALLRWLGYFSLTGLVLALYLSALAGLFQIGAPRMNPALLGLFAGILVLPMGWVFRGLLRWLRKRFRRDHIAIRDQILGALRESSQRLSELGLVKHFEQALRESYQPQQLCALDASNGQFTLPLCERVDDEGILKAFPPTPLALPPSLLRHARENRELVLGLGTEEADWIREQNPQLRDHIDALGLQLMVILMAHELPHTVLLLGGKYAELGYGRDDRELLREAAIAGGAMLETVQLHQRVVAQERASQELATARRIQESLLPQKAPEILGFQMALRLEPALETGGDLLFLKRRPSGRWIAAVGDVSGKGLAAALYMSQAVALLELATCQEDQPLEQILERMDHTLRHLLGQRGFLTLALLEWDETGQFRLARAGHPGALLIEPGKEPRELVPHGRGLGLRPAGPGDWEILEGVLTPKSWIVLYSDGLTEAMDQKGQLFGLDRMSAQLKRIWGTGSVRAACEAVFREVAGFETQNRDDRTLFILGREVI
jgi:serine phosphatase RsbU (regulator of sigma subunit)